MEKELSAFLKFAYEKGKVRNVTEAFDEYPPNEEWHKGKIENILCEETLEYSIYEIGDIVFVKKYYYEDGTTRLNHLFVIVEQNYLAVPIENFGMLISSKLDKLKFDTNKLLEKNKNNRLNKDSIIKTDVIYKIYNDQILFKIGKVDKQKVEEYKKCFLKNANKQKDM